MKDFTLEEIDKRIKKNDCDWFYSIYNNHWGKKDLVETVYDQHWGDGNDYYLTLHFKKTNTHVLLEGTYSSWDAPYWHQVSYAKPYTFTETRWRAAEKDEIRDDKINTILDNGKGE